MRIGRWGVLITLAACGGGDVPPTQPPAGASAIEFTALPSAAVAGSAIAGVSVRLVNVSGALAVSATDSVRLQLLAPAGAPAATASGRVGRRAAAGVATFDSVVVTSAGTGYRLIATAPGLTADTSASFDVAAAAAAQLAFTSAPPNGRVAVILGTASVSLTDAFGNPAAGTVVMTLDSAPAGAALSGTTSAAAANGVASFAGLQVTLPGTRMRLRASANGLAVQSTPFDVVARLKILDAATPLVLGTSYTFHVAIQTDAGATIPGASATIQLSIQNSLAVQPPGSSRSAATAAGVATISGISPARAGSGFRLVATAPGLDADSSAALAVTWAPVQAAASGAHTCARTAAGRVACVGFNYGGRLGDGTGDTVLLVPALVRSSVLFSTIAAGGGHDCGLTAGGQAWCWGYNGDGQLGIGVVDLSASRDTAAAVAGGHTFVSIQPAGSFTCGLRTDSLAYCWGMDLSGSLGTGVPGSVAAPAAVAGSHRFGRLSSGPQHTCGLDASGHAWCWGLNAAGQLGANNFNDATTPVAAVPSRVFTAIAAGISHTCALDAAGKAWCWGTEFQLGNPAFPNAGGVDTAVAVAGGLTFTSIAAGGAGTCGIVAGGAAYCWGKTIHGQTGTGTFGPQALLQPGLVLGSHAWTSISVGGDHVCGIASGLWCWGRDNYGQLGDGAPRTSVHTPTLVIQ